MHNHVRVADVGCDQNGIIQHKYRKIYDVLMDIKNNDYDFPSHKVVKRVKLIGTETEKKYQLTL